MAAALITDVRLVPLTTPAPPGLVSVRIRGGVVTEIGPGLKASPDEERYDGAGRWAIPGLWDQHVHLGQWAATRSRLDLAGTAGPQEVLDRVAAHVAGLPPLDDATIQGFGYRSATWSEPASVAALDAVSGAHPIVLISGDAHNAWLNSAALAALGLPSTQAALDENDWFAVFPRLGELPGADTEAGYASVVAEAAAKGIVGVVDMEFAANYGVWPPRVAAGVDALRVRCATYLDTLDDVIAAGLRTGAPLAGDGLVTMGPLKIITDGSLNTRTAYCHQPYADADPTADRPCGAPNLTTAELADALRRARAAGLEVAAHAIGDAAVADVVAAFAATAAHGSIEHAQLVAREDVPRIAALGLRASVQPAHLLDDRDVTMRCWPDRSDRCFPLRALHEAGVELALGSDAPVAPLDPWLAMGAAVHRSADQREAWHPEQALTVAQALAASVDGQGTVRVGGRGDVVLLDADPLAAGSGSADAAARLWGIPVAATFVAGRPTFAT